VGAQYAAQPGALFLVQRGSFINKFADVVGKIRVRLAAAAVGARLVRSV